MDTLETKIPISAKAVWREAMKYGAILGLATVVIDIFLPKLWQPDTATLMAEGGSRVTSAFAATLVSVLFFLAKTAFYIWLMVFFTKKVAAAYDNVNRSHTFRFGMFLGLFSGLITAAAALVQFKLMDAAALNELIDSTMASQSYSISPEMIESMSGTIMNILPFFTFIVMLAKCFLIGLLAASIISRSIPGRTSNPFEQR
ncbi:MAG: DUF4199 domain-containing protein [Bacteroidales bacterium]|nr:DUF4199 domain-containing protein [Bacteroidales bacterium]